jgi:hypothetical protein
MNDTFQAAPPRVRASAIEEIRLERTLCDGPCPVYTVTLRRDGTALWEGRQYVEREGHFEGEVYERDFARLAEAIIKLRYFTLPDDYLPLRTDMASAITTVRWKGGQKSVDNYGDQGPAALWQIETLIDGVAAAVRWRRVRGTRKKSSPTGGIEGGGPDDRRR